ncbi:hypothetical protein HKD37_16G045469 [Glycine soja]
MNRSHQLSQPTLGRGCEKAKIDWPKMFISKGENERSRHEHLFEENIRKPKRGLRILKIRVRELFTHGEGISTPRAYHKGRQPLIECAKHDFKIGVALAPTYPQVRSFVSMKDRKDHFRIIDQNIERSFVSYCNWRLTP